MNKLLATVTIYGKIECVTGLHIGGSGSGYEIGGMDNPVIRNPVDDFPYIPGSSLKGKMRSLTEWAEGAIDPKGEIYKSSNINDVVCRIFGAPAEADRKTGPTRLIVRDAILDAETRKKLEDLEAKQGLPKVEVKTEVNINRITSKPLSGPRQSERVPVGSKFDFEMLFSLYDVDGVTKKDFEMLDPLFMALRLVEDSALGGSGSRGYGQVKFHIGDPLIRTVADYQQGTKAVRSEQLTSLREWTAEQSTALKTKLRALY